MENQNQYQKSADNTDEMIRAMEGPITSRGVPESHDDQTTKTKKWMAGAIAILAAALLGTTIWGILETVNGNQLAAEMEEHLQEDQASNELASLGLDNILIQRLYRDFDGATDGASQISRFYTDEDTMEGVPEETLMTQIAMYILRTDPCRGEYAEGDICYDGERVAFKIEERFGKKIEFVDGEALPNGPCGLWIYDATYQEFHSASTDCTEDPTVSIQRQAYAAERKGNDDLYLYEIVVGKVGDQYYKLTDVNQDGQIVDFEQPLENLTDEDGEINLVSNRDKLDKFKWSFRRTSDGNYVFAGLERMNK